MTDTQSPMQPWSCDYCAQFYHFSLGGVGPKSDGGCGCMEGYIA